MDDNTERSQVKLAPYMTPAGAWAFSIGTAIGWGSFVVTCTTYLASAGILGTVFGLAAGMLVIFVITKNLQYMICSGPDAGGIYSYCRKINGHDYGFITAWFLFLTYSAILWANVTSLPLFARYFLGDVFRFGFIYSVFGYDVYAGNILLSVAALILVGILCAKSSKVAQKVMIVCCVIFTGGIVLLFLLCLIGHGTGSFSFEPAFLPEKSELNQIVRIAVISPWAFIGFENIAHFSAEFTFPLKKIRPILMTSVIMSTVMYVLVTLLSVTAYPPGYATWLDYIRDLDNLSGIEGVPAFYAAYHYLHGTGIAIVLVTLFCIILTSLIGNLTALSRLIFALSRDEVIPGWFGKTGENGVPANAVIAGMIPGLLISFLGRTAIGWIVDVTTLGATMIYGFMSYAVYNDADKKKDKTEKVTGLCGLILMIAFVVMLLVPDIIDYNAMATETYFLFAVWSVLGLILFRWTVKHDSKRYFGRSIVVWTVLLMLILFTSLVWVGENNRLTSEKVMSDIAGYYAEHAAGASLSDAESFLKIQHDRIVAANTTASALIFVLFVFCVWIMIGNFIHIRKWEKEDSARIGAAERRANTDPLTGVKSKAAYIRAEQEIDDRIAMGEEEDFSVVVCDINDLKLVNDTKGHEAGDDIIKAACREICKVFKHSPVFRIGGDEFVAILRGEDHEVRGMLVDKINRMADANNAAGDGIVISIGISDYIEGQDNSLRSVFEQADIRMYERKKELKEQR